MADAEFRDPYPTATVPEESATPEQPVAEEPRFQVGEKEVPWTEVPQEARKEWYDAATNRKKWQAENTQRAQEIAAARKELEEWRSKRPDYEKNLDEYQRWDKFLNDNKELLEVNRLYASNDPRVRKFAQELAGQAQQQPASDPRVMEAMKRVADLEKRLESRDAEAREAKATAERDAAYADLAKEPGFDREKFDEFFKEMTSKAGDTKTLLKLVHSAWKGSNPGALKQEAQAEYAAQLAEKKKAGVEKGGAASLASASQKYKPGGGYDAAMTAFLESQGIVEEDPWTK